MQLLEPFKIGDFTVKNRIVVPPSEGTAQRDGKLSHTIFEYYMRLVKQGVGTVILDSSYVIQNGKYSQFQLGISEEEHVNGLKNLVKFLTAEGVYVGIRLSHAGAKTNEKICGEQPIGPIAINFGKDYDLSREFQEDDVEEICLFFAQAIERAEEIGIHFVELNGAQQQLFDQCLNNRYNNRDDEYGGTLENRLNLSLKVIQAMKSRVKNRIPISYFFSIHDKLESNLDEFELKKMIQILDESGVDYFHPITIHVMNKFFSEEMTLLEWVSKFTKKPIIIEGNIKSTSVLREILSIDKATMYCFDKSLFNRPNWFHFLQKKISN